MAATELRTNPVGHLVLGPGDSVPGNPAVTWKVTEPLKAPNRRARQPRQRADGREPEESERPIPNVWLRTGTDAESELRIDRFCPHWFLLCRIPEVLGRRLSN